MVGQGTEKEKDESDPLSTIKRESL
jgi:hypothetical protein